MFNTPRVFPLLLLTVVGAPTTAQQLLKSQPPLWNDRPDVAAFERQEHRHLDAAHRAIAALVAVKGTHTVDNTVAPYDEAVRELNSAQYYSFLMEAVHPDAAFRDRATAMTRAVSAAVTELSLNEQVYHALSAVTLDQADPATRYYVGRQLLEFRRAGVDRAPEVRAKLKELNDRLTTEQSAFERNINDDHRSVRLTGAAELDGLPADFVERHKPGADGAITLTTDYPDFLPAMKFARSDDLRRRLLSAFDNRAYPKNRDALLHILATRHELATTLGYRSWADYHASDKMIGNGAAIGDFIRTLDGTVRPDASREYSLLLAEKRKTEPDATAIAMHEKAYYQELLRRARYDFDSQSVRPYFPFATVERGILDTAASLFHLTFQQEKGVPAWHPSVETWVILDGQRIIGRFYLDLHPRPGKYTHAEMATVLDGVRGRQLPEAALICNFPEPTANDPALMEYGDVQTFFHEFGHLLHSILGGNQRWAGISGISMEADFVEAPSQMLEEVIHSPQVLAGFARHYQTGQPIPAALVDKMNKASAFGRALYVGQQIAYTALSYDLYKADPATLELDAVAHDDTIKYVDFTPLPDDHFYASFGHLSGYSSGYYTYMWDLVIAQDFFGQFNAANPLADDTPMKYRRSVLEPGGSMSANDLVKNFLGRPQSMAAFERWLGREFDGDAR